MAIEQPDLQLISGIYRGIFEQSPEYWQENIDRLLVNDKLVRYYSSLILTGEIQKIHLDALLDLIKKGVLSPNEANRLSYGSVIDDVEPTVVANFCIKLSKEGEQGSWSALNVLYMYCYTNKAAINTLRDTLKVVTAAVPLHKDQGHSTIDVYHWHDMAERLLRVEDKEFASALTNQIITASKHGLNYGDIWSYLKPLMLQLMNEYGEVLWPIIADAIDRSEAMDLYWLQQLLSRETGLNGDVPSVLSNVSEDVIIEWCLEHRDLGPVFVAGCINVFERVDGELQPTSLLIAILDHFGGDKRVTGELNANMATRGWSGSLVPYLESDKKTLSPLLTHKSSNVRDWVVDQIAYLELRITEESQRDEEYSFGFH